ncbi:hypothetical protein Kpol_460p25, partial [Vanderwaltozyma polyspora DSM 70294]
QQLQYLSSENMYRSNSITELSHLTSSGNTTTSSSSSNNNNNNNSRYSTDFFLNNPSLLSSNFQFNEHYTPSPTYYQRRWNEPLVTTTVWQDENTLCYQVEVNGVSVVRRADNDMINGTKLLNVTKMTRGRRDGILKAEKIRHVVKVGSMNLKGVWIPFERALLMAKKEKIIDKLYPLFVKDIQSTLNQHPVTYFNPNVNQYYFTNQN